MKGVLQVFSEMFAHTLHTLRLVSPWDAQGHVLLPNTQHAL